MFIHTQQLFGRHAEKRPEKKCLHLRDASIHSNSSTCSTLSSASTTPSTANNSPTHSTFAASSSAAASSPTRSGPPSSPKSPKSAHPDRTLDFDPLMQHPTHAPPPPRLSERPMLQQDEPRRRPSPPQQQPSATTTIKAPTPVSSNAEWKAQLAHMLEMSVANLSADTPRHTIHTSTPAKAAEMPPTDYFMWKMPIVPVRPELKSHWSESTAASSDEEDEDEDEDVSDDETEYDDSNASEELLGSQSSTPDAESETPTPPATAFLVEKQLKQAEARKRLECEGETYERLVKEPHVDTEEPWPFTRPQALTRVDSTKRSTISIPAAAASAQPASPTSPTESQPRRPRMKTIDSVEDFVKRGGWKRRGIVFQQGEARAAVGALVAAE